MTAMLRAAAAALILIGAATVPAPAANPTPTAAAISAAAVLTPTDRADLARFEKYFNEIKTLKARFLQVAESGHQAVGTFFLARPDRMRLEYDPPIKDFIVADGWFVFFWDGELKQQSSQPIGSSLADVILRENFRLSGDITVTKIERGNGWLEITVAQTEDIAKGRLTLVLEDKPLRLHKWRVLDAQNLVTDVTLTNLQINIPLDRELFFFKAPEGGGAKPR